MTPSDGIYVRSVTPADYERLAHFLSSFADETRADGFWLKRFKLWWDANPAFEERIPRGWILWNGLNIKGFLGNVPTQFQLSGRTVVAFNTTTWRVLPMHRNHSLRPFYQALHGANESIFFDTTPSDDVVRILKGLKFHLFPHLENARKSFIIINPKQVLKSRAPGKVSAALWSWFGGPALQALQTCRLRPVRASDGLEVRRLTRADSSFDELWLRTRHLYANTNVRSSAVTNWQCFANENFGKLLFGCYRAKLLVGYLIAVSRIRDGLRVLSCLDIWLDPDAGAALSHLLSFVQHWAQEEGVDLMEIIHFNPTLSRHLTSLGLPQRDPVDEQPAYYRIPGLGTLDPAASYLVALQGDRGL